jgi:hypothetical protein
MKRIVGAVLSLLLATPALAGGAPASCWSSAEGSHLVVPPVRMAVSYYHDRTVEPCDAMPTESPLSWHIWCDVSSRSGLAYYVPAGPGHGRSDRVLWDGQTFFPDRRCTW